MYIHVYTCIYQCILIMVFSWKNVGLHVPSSSSSAICVLRMADCRGTVHTKLDQVYTSIYLYIIVYTVLNHFIMK